MGSDGETPVGTFNDVMIDIETLSLHRHKALILSVGMVEFDPSDICEPRFGNRSLVVFNVLEQIMLGRRVDVGTQQFWAKQPAAASEHWLFPGTRAGVSEGISIVRRFCSEKARVWANGTQFDLSNLDGLAEDIGDTKELWHYQAPRDMRTFCRETAASRIVPLGDALDIPGVPHEPVYDCISQAWQVWSHWQDH